VLLPRLSAWPGAARGAASGGGGFGTVGAVADAASRGCVERRRLVEEEVFQKEKVRWLLLSQRAEARF